MKVLKKATIVQKAKTAEHTRTERQVLEAVRRCPFLVTLHWAFQTESKLHLIMGLLFIRYFMILFNFTSVRSHEQELMGTQTQSIFFVGAIMFVSCHVLSVAYRDTINMVSFFHFHAEFAY